jgi:alanyl-tRNA synthetase
VNVTAWSNGLEVTGGQNGGSGPVREVLRGEERRFASLLTCGRKVLAQLDPGRALTEADLRYLHQTHGLPPELVTELLEQPPSGISSTI